MSDNKNKKALSNDDLMGLIVHSYNNYLAGIMGYSELALLECDNNDVQDRLNLSMESGIDAVHFGKTILASLGRLQVPMQDLSLFEIIQSVGKKHQQLVIESDLVALENIKIKTDTQWFEECLLDLVEFFNSADKVDKPQLSCIVNEQNNLIVIRINNAELMLSEQDASQLFDPFYSSRKMTGKKDIGLAKAYGFFTQMKAVLSWKNGQGFVLEIPIEPNT